MKKKLFKSYFIKTLLTAMLVVIMCMRIIIGLNACTNKNNTQGNGAEDSTEDTTSQPEPMKNRATEANDSETMKVTVDGIEYPLYLYSDYITKPNENNSPRLYSGNLPMVVLTNAVTKTVPPTLVFQGDMFLDWEVAEIEVYHVFYEENGIIKVSCDEAVIKFKGEITIKAEIIYNWDELWDDESLFATLTDDYQGRFPQMVNEEYGTGFLLGDINNKAAEILNNKYGRYECEITIKDYNLNNQPICIFSTATLVDMKVLSVIEYYE